MASVEDQLNNLAWHAVTGAQRELAEFSADGLAARFDRDVTIFWGVEHGDAADWAALRDLAGKRAIVLLRSGDTTAPPGWDELFREVLTQYVADDVASAPGLDVVTLGADDAAEMVALAKLTEPGPFAIRTHEMGHYIGVRRDGHLVAMAGERLQTEDWSEISGVCVHPDARRSGLAAALTQRLVREIRDRGQQAMLHVRDGNDAAHALYQRIGFRLHGEVTVSAWRVADAEA